MERTDACAMVDGRTVPHVYNRFCIDCGRAFSTNGANSRRCPECTQRAKVEYSKRYRADARAAKIAKNAGRPRAKPVRKPKEKWHCPYCGRDAVKGEFCTSCRENGWDNVYLTFGITNGWDKEKIAKPKPVIKAGWRGRRVIGCNAHMGRRYE